MEHTIDKHFFSALGRGHPKPRICDFLWHMKLWTYFVFFLVPISFSPRLLSINHQVGPILFIFARSKGAKINRGGPT